MLSVLVWNSVRLISSSHAERLENQTDEQSELLANILAPGLATSDRAVLLDSLTLIADEVQIEYATVYNSTGQLMAGIGQAPDHIKADASYADAKDDGVFDVIKQVRLFGQSLGRLQVGYSIREVEQLIKQTRLQNTVIAAIEIFLSTTVTLLLGYLLTRSLRKLEEGAKALTRDELHHRIEVDSKDEMGDLARSFNRLAQHLSDTRTELEQEHQTLVQQSLHLRTLLDGVDAVIVEGNGDLSHFRYVSGESKRLLGYSTDEWLQPDFVKTHIHPDDLDTFISQTEVHSTSSGSFSLDFRMLHQDGHSVWVRSIATIDRAPGGLSTARGLLLDVTEQRQSEERVVYLAQHDALTGLYNRYRFHRELERALDYAERFDQEGALMFIDLDQFKYINDTLGHRAGDDCLSLISQTLSGSLRKVDVLGRLGGDEFGIILPRMNRVQVGQVAADLLRTLAEAKSGHGELNAPVTASIGIVVFPTDSSDPGTLLSMADAAMYRVKDRGRNGYHVYRDGDQTLINMQAKLQWEHRIRTALEENRFVLHFQPIFELAGNSISHYEVLLRMRDPERGLIPPEAFLSVAERFGLIGEIDRWVLRNAFRAQADSIAGDAPVSLAINLSGCRFGNPETLDWIKDYLRESGSEPARLMFEITETAALENLPQAARFTDALHSLGCRIALDDFGVGYSSFQYLKHLPVDYIKIDGSFVGNLTADRFDRVFVKAMSDMARGLNMQCIAEGVETEIVIPILLEMGVNMAQGYHLAKPSAGYLGLGNETNTKAQGSTI